MAWEGKDWMFLFSLWLLTKVDGNCRWAANLVKVPSWRCTKEMLKKGSATQNAFWSTQTPKAILVTQHTAVQFWMYTEVRKLKGLVPTATRMQPAKREGMFQPSQKVIILTPTWGSFHFQVPEGGPQWGQCKFSALTCREKLDPSFPWAPAFRTQHRLEFRNQGMTQRNHDVKSITWNAALMDHAALQCSLTGAFLPSSSMKKWNSYVIRHSN